MQMSAGTRRMCVAVLVLAGAVWVAWRGFRVTSTGDYAVDYGPAMNALLAGHVGAFFSALPTNGAGGSLLLRAPAAVVGKLLGAGQLAIFRFGALACVLAAGAVGLTLARAMRAEARSWVARAAVVGLFVLGPAVLDAITFGHPEEPLGAALCIGAVLLSGRDRAVLAGAALGLAIICKPWGVLAVFPVMLAAPGGRLRISAGDGRLRIAAVAGAIAAAWTAGAYLASPEHFSRIILGAGTAVVAHPVDLWWPLARLHIAPGITPAYLPPRLVADHARELAVLLSIPLAIPLALRRERSIEVCLALLALLFLVRCLLDPSNHVYYQAPFVLALCAYEARTRGLPVLSLLSLAGVWLVFHVISGTGNLTAQFIAYLTITLPLAAVLARVVVRASRRTRFADRPARLSLARSSSPAARPIEGR